MQNKYYRKNFKCKSRKRWKHWARNTKTQKNFAIVVPLKYLSNFWRTLDRSLINCKVFLPLTWFENCLLTDITTQAARTAQGDNPARAAINAPTNATFKMIDTKLCVPVVTLSTQNDKILLEQLITWFKRTIKWNKYWSKMTNQTKNKNLNYLIDLTFTKVNQLFILSKYLVFKLLCTKCSNKRL